MGKTDDEMYYHAKSVDTVSAESLEADEIGAALDLLLQRFGLEIVRTRYYSHGDPSVTRVSLAEKGTTKTGFFEE